MTRVRLLLGLLLSRGLWSWIGESVSNTMRDVGAVDPPGMVGMSVGVPDPIPGEESSREGSDVTPKLGEERVAVGVAVGVGVVKTTETDGRGPILGGLSGVGKAAPGDGICQYKHMESITKVLVRVFILVPKGLSSRSWRTPSINAWADRATQATTNSFAQIMVLPASSRTPRRRFEVDVIPSGHQTRRYRASLSPRLHWIGTV